MDSLEEWLTQPEGVATGLKALRARADMTGRQVADATGWEQSKISRIENGKQKPTAADIEAWGRATGASATDIAELLARRKQALTWNVTFQARMSGGQAAVQRDYNALVARSALIRHLETVWVPGLLQVPEYAHRVFTEMKALHESEVDDIDASVATRMERQRYLYDPAKRFEFLLFEPVIRSPLPGPAVMRAQLDRLYSVIGMERIRFGIVPLDRPLAHTPQGAVQIYGDTAPVAIVEDLAGEMWFRGDDGDQHEKVQRYIRGIDWVWEEAVEGNEARELIMRAIRALPEA